jgi:ribosomal protein L37AE/L43A
MEINDNPQCPHCGHVHDASETWGDGIYECEECGKKFQLWGEISITYTTDKV